MDKLDTKRGNIFIEGFGLKDTALMHNRLIKHLVEGKPLYGDTALVGGLPPIGYCASIVFRNLYNSDEFDFLFHTFIPRRLKADNIEILDFCLLRRATYNNYHQIYCKGTISTINESMPRNLIEKEMYELDDILMKFSKYID